MSTLIGKKRANCVHRPKGGETRPLHRKRECSCSPAREVIGSEMRRVGFSEKWAQEPRKSFSGDGRQEDPSGSMKLIAARKTRRDSVQGTKSKEGVA